MGGFTWRDLRIAVEENGQLVLFFDGASYHQVISVTNDGVKFVDGEIKRDDLLEHQRFYIARPFECSAHPAMDVEEKVEPYEMPGSPETVKRSHPSYGNLYFSRVSGSAILFDSELNHQHYVTLTISRAQLIEDNTGYRCWPTNELIEVCLSEVQFARAITSLNSGSGTPCTLHHINRQTMPKPPRKRSLLEKHDERLNKFVKDHQDSIEPFIEMIAEWRSKKHRPTLKEMEELMKGLMRCSEYAKGNVEFAHELLVEAADEAVAIAKTEIDGYVHNAVVRTGLEQLKSAEFSPKRIESTDLGELDDVKG